MMKEEGGVIEIYSKTFYYCYWLIRSNLVMQLCAMLM